MICEINDHILVTVIYKIEVEFEFFGVRYIIFSVIVLILFFLLQIAGMGAYFASNQEF